MTTQMQILMTTATRIQNATLMQITSQMPMMIATTIMMTSQTQMPS
jgi:hypothetical protein